MQVEGGGVALMLPHKTPPRVPPKPTSKSPTQSTLVSKVAATRHQSPSPVRHVKAPTPTPVRPVSPTTTRLSVSPIRPVKSPVMVRKQVTPTADVLPPWKQGDYTEASLTRMTGGTTHVQTSTQISMEQRWESAYGMQEQAAGAVGVSVKEDQHESDKTNAVATVIAAVDQARGRIPLSGIIERTSTETSVTAMHLQPMMEQGKGGKKKEAVATVLAAVDQARVRKPVHEEGGHAEEGVIEYGLAQQFVTVQAPKQEVITKTVKTEAMKMTPPIQIPSPEKSVHFAQIERSKETITHVDTALSPSPVPHFTVSKVTVPKPDHSYE
ncbi:hypothetical protein JZ751_020097, partial [Albula glossodonta]